MNFIDDFKDIWNKDRGRSLSSYLKSNKQADEFLESILKQDSWFETKRNVFYFLMKGTMQPVLCKHCGKRLSIEAVKENRKYCSHKCSGNSIDRLEKVKKTTLQRYGVENAFQNKEIQQKQKKTCLNKYNVENVFKNEQIKKKIRKTNKEKYGFDNVSKNDQIKKKVKDTNLKKYGKQFVLQNDQIKQKIQRTNLNKYGVKYPAQNKKVVDKMKQTCIEKYGVDCSLKNDKINDKRQKTWNKKYNGNPSKNINVSNKKKKTNFLKFGSEFYQTSPVYFKKLMKYLKERWKKYVIPLFSQEEYFGANKNIVYKWKCVKCGNEFEQKLYTTTHTDESYEKVPRCLNCFPLLSGYSNLQKEVLEFIKSIYNGKIIENDRNLIKPLEIDIYLPEKNLAIEFDGLFWHNAENKPKDYHLFKTELCEKQGIQLIHIFEYEWKQKQEIVKDIIRSKLGIYDRKIYARKCIFKQIDEKTASGFSTKNHLQGYIDSDVKYGLFYENKLVFVMTFSKSCFDSSYEYVLTRFASKLTYQVVGGVSRLLTTFKRNFKASLITYVDKRYSNGKLYEKLGFELISQSKPEYVKIDKYKIYDCGKLIFKLK